MDELFNKYEKTREKVREKFRNQGLNEDQIDIKMNGIDNNFFLHLWVNGKDFSKGTNEDRMDFYIRSLKLELNSN